MSPSTRTSYMRSPMASHVRMLSFVAARELTQSPVDIGALMEPLAVAWHSVKRSNLQPGDRALVLGAGPVGRWHRTPIPFTTVPAYCCDSDFCAPHLTDRTAHSARCQVRPVTHILPSVPPSPSFALQVRRRRMGGGVRTRMEAPRARGRTRCRRGLRPLCA